MFEKRIQVNAGDRKVPELVLGAGDKCMSYWPEEPAGTDQWAGGPSHIVIGRTADDDALKKVSIRYGIPVAQLRAVRDELPKTSAITGSGVGTGVTNV
jgi:hypothetical protein